MVSRVVTKVSLWPHKETQYNNCDQFIFLHDLHKRRCTYMYFVVSAILQLLAEEFILQFLPQKKVLNR